MEGVEVQRESLRLRTAAADVPLGFVRRDSTVYLVARERSSQWPVDALREGSVTLTFRDGPRSGGIFLIADPVEREAVLDQFRSKYGPTLYARWYEHPARVLRVDLAPAGEAVGRPPVYLDWLEAEFDNVADDYDRHITGNRMNRLLRDRSLARLRPLFDGQRQLLEIGCGSGMETLKMLGEGHSVVAVDISSRMLATVREKAKREGLSERLSTEKLRAVEVDRLVGRYGEGAFDGGYSTYGALNCEPDLRPIPPALHRLLAPGKKFLAGVYNRWCLAELVGYSFTLQFRRAFGRRSNPIPVGASRFCIDVFAYSAPEFAALCRPYFSVERVEGVPVFLPPSDLTGYAEKFARHFDTLARWDASLGRRWPLSALGDHFLMTLGRSDPAPAG
ncbi:MAG TPA: methyltransferase domain-containing protein [Thermoplasmata archaeon]